MQSEVGNAAVARMLAQPAATTRTLARLVDPTAIARRVHEAVDGIGTDE
jgi:hypothetical protein